jgi:hypothetical protein
LLRCFWPFAPNANKSEGALCPLSTKGGNTTGDIAKADKQYFQSLNSFGRRCFALHGVKEPRCA